MARSLCPLPLACTRPLLTKQGDVWSLLWIQAEKQQWIVRSGHRARDLARTPWVSVAQFPGQAKSVQDSWEWGVHGWPPPILACPAVNLWPVDT